MAKKEKSSGRVGAFFGGSFFGFILCLALIAGLGYFVYFKVSPNWINKTFKTNINLGSEEINNKTLKNFVDTTVGLVQNLDSYTLENLNEDFGIKIKDKFKGIDISDLKTVPLKELGAKLQTKLTQISASELEVELVNFSGDIAQILDSSYIYYYNQTDNMLYGNYDGSVYSDMVTDNEFVYEINENKVLIKGNEFNIVDGKVSIQLKYLPLMSALGNFSELKIADVMGFSYNGTVYYDDKNNNGIMDSGEELSTILNIFADTQIGQLPYRMNSLTLADMFAEDERDGIMSLIDNPEKVLISGTPNVGNGELSISDAFAKVIEEKTLGQLADAGLIDNNDFESVREKWIDTDLTVDGKNYVQVQDMTLNELINYSLKVLDEGGLLLDSNPTT